MPDFFEFETEDGSFVYMDFKDGKLFIVVEEDMNDESTLVKVETDLDEDQRLKFFRFTEDYMLEGVGESCTSS